MDGVAVSTDPLIARLQIKAVVEVERRAVLIELRADPGVIGEDEIHLLWPGEQGTLDFACRNAFGALLLEPFNIGKQWMGLHRYADDHFIFDDQASDSLADGTRLRGEHAEQ